MNQPPRQGLFPSLPQPRDVKFPDLTSDTFAAFNAIITGDISQKANMLAVWSPQGARFVLRGGYVLVACTTTCNGAGAAGTLLFFDEEVTQPVLPLGTYFNNATAAGDVVCGVHMYSYASTRNTSAAWRFDLGRGYRSFEEDNTLYLGGTTLGAAGALRCSGLVWGVQE